MIVSIRRESGNRVMVAGTEFLERYLECTRSAARDLQEVVGRVDARLYKYVGASYRESVVGVRDQVSLKCSYPREYGDPYELFLTADFTAPPEILAYYAEAIGELPQVPTTCFSRSPIIVPMWAHYAEALRGFVIEFDEPRMAATYPRSVFGDVQYRSEPDGVVVELLNRAVHIKKMRYTYMLHGQVFHTAYFTKAVCWEYEQERRMVVKDEALRRDDDALLLDVPKECVTALVCGPRASPDTAAVLQAKAEELGCRYFHLRIGRSTATPFFVDSAAASWVFDGAGVCKCESACDSCGEPVKSGEDRCSWCQVTDAHAQEAAMSNPFRLLARIGMLDRYIEHMNSPSRSRSER